AETIYLIGDDSVVIPDPDTKVFNIADILFFVTYKGYGQQITRPPAQAAKSEKPAAVKSSRFPRDRHLLSSQAGTHGQTLNGARILSSPKLWMVNPHPSIRYTSL
ncbi:hypothetical protein ACROYT_G026067, partial [Oculina patagonica]